MYNKLWRVYWVWQKVSDHVNRLNYTFYKRNMWLLCRFSLTPSNAVCLSVVMWINKKSQKLRNEMSIHKITKGKESIWWWWKYVTIKVWFIEFTKFSSHNLWSRIKRESGPKVSTGLNVFSLFYPHISRTKWKKSAQATNMSWQHLW